MHKTRIGVLRGGPSAEYEVSLNTGASILDAIRSRHEHTYDAVDIFIDRNGVWHIGGQAVNQNNIGHKVDVIFNALHGNFGEDGKVQSFLEAHGIPFTGSGSLASAISMNKVLAKNIFKNHGIKTPYWKEILSSDVQGGEEKMARELFLTFTMPAVVKPTSSGSSIGVYIVRTINDLVQALKGASEHGDSIIIEEMISGIETTCGVIEGFRSHELYALPPIEIRAHNGFFDYQGKYEGKSDEIVPATFPDDIKRAVEELARSVHRVLGLRHYSRSDFIIHPKRGIYVLEANTLPGLTKESLMPKSLRAVGSDVHELVDYLVKLAMGKLD